jgi:probable HAF family extracellular repeat protein
MPRPERLVPVTLVVLVALAVWLGPPTVASPAAREATRTILPPLPDADPTRGTGASDIDNHGRITGSSDYRPVLWQDGEVVELTGFPDDVVIQVASKINDRGQVVAAGSTVVSGDLVHYVWQDGRVPTRIELGRGRRASQFFDLNERGQALVAGVDADGRFVVGLWQDGTFTEVAPWSYGVVPPADLAAWRFAQVPVLSNDGHVAGQQIRGECPPFPPYTGGSCESRSVVWHDGAVTVLPGGNGVTAAVNSRGDVVGEAQPYGDAVWRDGQPSLLGMEPHDINDRGQVAGIWGWWLLQRAAVWEDGRLTVLGTLGGWNSQAYAVNESGQVMGLSDTASGERHVFLWDDGEMIDLTPHANDSDASPWPIAMNDAGQVVGYSETNGPINAELWEVSQG